MSDERKTSDELGDDLQTTKQAMQSMARAPKQIKQTVQDTKKAVQTTKKVAKKTKKAAKKAAKATKKAAKAAAKATGKFIKAIGHIIAATFPWSLIVILAIILIIMIFYLVTNSTIFNVLTKIFQEPTVDDIREYISNTQNDESDWRFYYNKMLPEEQYEYIYFGNHRDNTAEGNDIKGLADYIIEAYEEARKAFEQDLGDIEAYHNTCFRGGSTASIDDIDPLTWTKGQIDAYLQTKGIKVVGEHEDWYESGHTTKSGVYVRSRIQNYIEKLQNQTGGNYKGGYFDYLEFEDLEESEEEESKKEELILKRRLVLNLDLTYLANHDTLVGDLIQAADGKIVKDSDLTNVVTYLIAGMNVATCDISPSKGYLDFLEKTIGNPDVWDPAVKYQGNVNLSGVLGAIIHGAEEMRAYSLFTTAKVKFKDQNGKNRKEKMGILDTTVCEAIPLEACDPGYVGKYGEPVREYYIVMKNPIDTDRLLWAMFVSDAGKTVTYEGIFNCVTQAYQGSYYDMYCIFEPINAAIHENFYTRFFAAITGTSASKTNSIAFAQYADAEQVRKYLYGLNQEEVENNDQYFHELWDSFEGDFGIMGKYKDMLTDYYLVDKDGSKTIDCDDFTGILNETYFTYHMRPLYKCDANLDITTKHNLAHDGYGVSSMDASSGSETPSADGGDSGGDYLERCLFHKIFPHDFGYENCEACLRKNGGYECDCEDGGINCVEWASDWPPECPDCKEFAQRALHGKIKVEYVRDPKPEFATLISITEDEYYTKIRGENPPGEDIGATLAAVKGNNKVDLTTNYNRYGYGDNYDPSIGEAEMSAAATHTEEKTGSETSSEFSETSDEDSTYKVVVPPEDAFHETGATGDDGKPKKKYFFSVYEFYGEYATAESWENIKSHPQNFHMGNADLIIMDPDKSQLDEFKSMQEISEEYNRAMYNKWAEAVKEGNGANVPANYRAVSVLSALYKRKYYYHNLLNTDSLDAGMYDEENGYERPVATYFYDPDNPDTAKYSESYTYDEEGKLIKTEDSTTAEVTPSNVKASGMSLGTVGVLTASVTVNTDSDVLSAEGPDDSSKSSGGSSYADEFDKEFTSNDERDTAFYGRPMDENESVDLDKKDTDKENFMDDPIEITKDNGIYSYFQCPGTDHYVAVADTDLMKLADDGVPFFVYCYEHDPAIVFIVLEGPEIFPFGYVTDDGEIVQTHQIDGFDGTSSLPSTGGTPTTGGGGGNTSPGTGGGGGSGSPAPGTSVSPSVDDATFFAEHANTSNSISNSLPYTYYNQTDGTEETDRCMQTSVAAMVDIATGGNNSVQRNDVDYDSGYVTVDGKTYYRNNATAYSADRKGYTNYNPSDGDEWQKIIMSEVDAGRPVVVHTTFINKEGNVSQHWVTVTGYTTDASGKIPDMSHLSGYDPWGGKYTNNLGTNTGVSHNGQWVHSDMRVETFNP